MHHLSDPRPVRSRHGTGDTGINDYVNYLGLLWDMNFSSSGSEVWKINVRPLPLPVQIPNIHPCVHTDPSRMTKSPPQRGGKVAQKPFRWNLTFILDQQGSKQKLFTFPRRPKVWILRHLKRWWRVQPIKSDRRNLKTKHWTVFTFHSCTVIRCELSEMLLKLTIFPFCYLSGVLL